MPNHFNNILRNRNVIAWLLIISAIALHVADETITGFLPFYNNIVERLREHLGFFPAPTFSFVIWFGGLIIGILLCFGFTIFIARGGNLVRWIATILGSLMIFNALGHLSGSLYFGKILPGTWSSPLLLLASLFMVFRGIQGDWQLQQESKADGASTIR
jgi:type II secretory pathway component PulF